MSDDERTATGWTESDGEVFLRYGDIFTPRRDELRRAFLELIPFTEHDRFCVLDLGSGSGWLTRSILERFKMAKLIMVDGAMEMLDYAMGELAEFRVRVEAKCVSLTDAAAIRIVYPEVDCVVSCLSLHHLDGPLLRRCLHELHALIRPGGCFLSADVAKIRSDTARKYVARRWSDYVNEQAYAVGQPSAFDIFTVDEWNYHDFPDDPNDTPATVIDQLRWLEEAGFEGVDVFWAEAGHALVGGYKS